MIKLHHPLLIAGLAASFLASSLGVPANGQTPLPPARLSQAGPPSAGAPMDVRVFYDQLADYGTWVEHPDYRYVFIPNDVGAGWRPYQEGRWVWTDAYGSYWESDEPFGWATYHYGRWGYDPAYGWFWVPGDTWSPAWVTWRRGGGRTGWAPVAPERAGFAIGRAQYYEPPIAESWVFVQDQYFGETDLAAYAAPIPEISVYLRAATDEYDPVWENGYYVNRALPPTAFDNVVRTRIVTRDIVYVDRQDDLFYDDNAGQIGVFAPRITLGDRLPPPPRVARTVEPDRRVVVRQYVRDDVPGDRRGLAAPSAALLTSLDESRRRELRERRFSDRDAYRRDLQTLERERADRIRELRQQAATRNDDLERERRQAIEQRRDQLERVRDERRQRAGQVQGRPDQPRPDQGGPAGQRPDMQRPAAPGMAPAPPAGAGTEQRRQQQDLRRQEIEQQRNQQQEQRRQQQDQRRQEIERQRGQQQEQQRQQQDQRRQEIEQQRNQQQEQRRQQQDQRRQEIERQRGQQQEQQRQRQDQRRREIEQQRNQQQEQRRQQQDQRRQEIEQQRGQQQEQRRQEMERRRQGAPDQPPPQRRQQQRPDQPQPGDGGQPDPRGRQPFPPQ